MPHKVRVNTGFLNRASPSDSFWPWNRTSRFCWFSISSHQVSNRWSSVGWSVGRSARDRSKSRRRRMAGRAGPITKEEKKGIIYPFSTWLDIKRPGPTLSGKKEGPPTFLRKTRNCDRLRFIWLISCLFRPVIPTEQNYKMVHNHPNNHNEYHKRFSWIYPTHRLKGREAAWTRKRTRGKKIREKKNLEEEDTNHKYWIIEQSSRVWDECVCVQ
jgi:hypothetical protein